MTNDNITKTQGRAATTAANRNSALSPSEMIILWAGDFNLIENSLILTFTKKLFGHKMKSRLIIILTLVFSACSSISENDIPILELNYPKNLLVIRRAEWGSVPLSKTIEQHEIKKITIHHGGVKFTKNQDAIESIRKLQSWSRSEKKWIDIPYHFMIDLEGKIYEGRPINYPGATNTEYDPTSHALIEVMGNYEIQEISEKQLNSLVDLAAFLARRFHVPPEEIKGHKDYSKMTVCPGRNLYKYLEDGTIVNRVREKLEEEFDK